MPNKATAPKATSPPKDHQLGALCHGLMAVIASEAGREMAVRQLTVLTLLKYDLGVEPTIRGLSHHMAVPKSAITRAGYALEELKLVRKAPGLDDKRVVRLQLTPAGHAYLRTITSSMSAAAEAQPAQ